MGPGPSDVHPRVLKAMATPLIGHLDPEFIIIMDEIKSMVQHTLKTQNELTFVVSAPGSAGMETCLVNLLEPGDEVVTACDVNAKTADIEVRINRRVPPSGDWRWRAEYSINGNNYVVEDLPPTLP